MTDDKHLDDRAPEPPGPELQVTSQPTELPSEVEQKVDAASREEEGRDEPFQVTERFTATDQKPELISDQRTSAGDAPDGIPTLGFERKSPVELQGQIAHFRVLETLGSGGFGTVVRAYDTQLDREVAVKIIRARSLGNKQVTRQFQEEARAAAQLRHPNIVSVHQSGQYSDDQVYIVYDYIRGPTLRDVLRKRRPLRTREAVSIMSRIARALGYAHGKGIAHRDVKPENVLIEDETDEPHVADFGCARRTSWQADDVPAKPQARSRPTRATNFVGTPVYFSPEQASGRSETAGAPADVWALGVMLDELVTGDRSFLEYETDRNKLMHAIQFVAPTPIRDRVPGVDRDLAAIWDRCLQKDPQLRYPTAVQLAEDLENWQRGLPVSVRPLSFVERLSRWGKRNPALAAAITAVFLAVSLGFAVSSVFYGRELLSKRDNVRNSIDRLFSEPTDGVASILKSLQQAYLHDVSLKSLNEQWQLLQDQPGAVAERKRLRIALAQFSLLNDTEDHENSAVIREKLILSIYNADPEELALLLNYLNLRNYPDDLRALQEVADDPQFSSGSRLRAICAVAKSAADQLPEEMRRRFAQKSTQFLQSELRQNTDLSNWSPLLKPLRMEMSEPLSAALASGKKSVGRLLYHLYQDDDDFLIRALPSAADDVMPDLLSNLSSSWKNTPAESIWERLNQQADEFSKELKGASYSQAVARLWLAGLHATDDRFLESIPILNDPQDPSAATYLTSRAYAYNVPLARLMAMLRVCIDRQELTAAQNYLIAIAKYPPESELEKLKALLRECHEHPDSGLHATAAWIMQRWGIAADTLEPAMDEYTAQRNWRMGPEHALMVRCPLTDRPFKMGSTLEELELAGVIHRSQHEGDADVYHLRVIPWKFEMGVTEITARAYLKFLDARIAQLERQFDDAESRNQDAVAERIEDILSHLGTMRLNVSEAEANSPVTSVPWHDAVAYCTWLSQLEGLGLCYGTLDEIDTARQKTRILPCDPRQSGYRLPLVSEWECMCRANSTTVWSCGNDVTLLGECATFRVNSNDHLWPVASRQPNRWGLFDMLGNALEWTSSTLRPYPPPRNTPYVEGPGDRLNSDQELLGIEVRGGSYAQMANQVRSAHRESAPAITAASGIGFRLARTLQVP